MNGLFTEMNIGLKEQEGMVRTKEPARVGSHDSPRTLGNSIIGAQ